MEFSIEGDATVVRTGRGNANDLMVDDAKGETHPGCEFSGRLRIQNIHVDSQLADKRSTNDEAISSRKRSIRTGHEPCP